MALFDTKKDKKDKPCDCQPSIRKLKEMEQYWELGIKDPSLRFRKRYMRDLCKPGECAHSDSFRATNAQATSRRTTNKQRRKAKQKQAAQHKLALAIMGEKYQYIKKLERQARLLGLDRDTNFVGARPSLRELKPQALAEMEAGKHALSPQQAAQDLIKAVDQYIANLEGAVGYSIDLKDLREGHVEPNWLGSTTVTPNSLRG